VFELTLRIVSSVVGVALLGLAGFKLWVAIRVGRRSHAIAIAVMVASAVGSAAMGVAFIATGVFLHRGVALTSAIIAVCAFFVSAFLAKRAPETD
jgi:hypothetical protein